MLIGHNSTIKTADMAMFHISPVFNATCR